MLETLQLLTLPPRDLPPFVAAFVVGWAFLVASCIGSFLNVVIARVPEGISVVTPRSRCPKCNTMIGARDNIPLVSWALLGGKCRACQAPISPRYPLIEALVGLLGMALVMRYGLSLAALELFAFAAILVAIAFIDLDTWTVPNVLTAALGGLGIAFGGVASWRLGSFEPLIARGIGALAAGLMLGGVVVVSTFVLRKTGRLKADEWAMGWGDPLILVGVGAFLGWRMLPVVLFLASVQGSVIGVALKAAGKLNWDKPVSDTDPWIPPKGALPFGPFLALGALQAAFFGEAILERLLPIWSIS